MSEWCAGLVSSASAAIAHQENALCLYAVLLFLLGIDVRWHNDELIPAERHVLVSNHVTTGDLMMLYKRPQRYVHLVAPGLPQRVTEVLCYHTSPSFSAAFPLYLSMKYTLFDHVHTCI